MVDGAVLKEMSYIMDETVLTYNIYSGEHKSFIWIVKAQ